MILRSKLLTSFNWLDHGFGTRLSEISQERMAELKQIHSAEVLVASSIGRLGEGDALVTNQRNVPVSVRTADCYPILLADPHSRSIAVIHAGWRGTAARIVGATIDKMCKEFATRSSDLYAVIGPGIGKCCYEVGPEVARLFGRDGTSHLDLADQNRKQLIAAGIPEIQIETLGECTFCNPERFHSFRRDKEQAGRMISYITIAR